MSEESNGAHPVPGDINKEIDLFWQISQSVVSRSYLSEILHLIVTVTAEVMRSKICSLMLLNSDKQELEIAATQALSPDYINKPNIKVGESVSGRAVKEGKPIAIADVTKEKGYQYPLIAAKEGVVSMISVPMFFGGRVIGVINSYQTKLHKFSEREIKLLQAVANQAAVAIENTKLREENAEVKQAFEERKLVDQAKALLMERDGLKEKDAYKLLQKTSRDRRKSMAEVANAIILAYSLRPPS
jgi:signal transduction protein with GAF and PtsI domain